MIMLPKILPAPTPPKNLPKRAKWLSGEGAGSWFVITESNRESVYVITRYSPQGIAECRGSFRSEKPIDLDQEYGLTYPSHCLKVNLVQDDRIIELNNLDCSLSSWLYG